MFGDLSGLNQFLLFVAIVIGFVLVRFVLALIKNNRSSSLPPTNINANRPQDDKRQS
jgi:multisubunit Na+/H+ antiporter MnhC subunit